MLAKFDPLLGKIALVPDKKDIGLANVPNVDCTNASNITSGVLALAQIPQSALERLYKYTGVQTTPELMGLTSSNVQNGDTIQIYNIANANHLRMWLVNDDSALSTAASFTEYVAGTAATVVTNANMTGAVTSVGNTTSLGSFTLTQLNTALSDADVATGGGTATGTNTGDQILSDATLTTSDIATNNATASKHGFLPKLSNNSTQYLNGQGNWVLPSGLVSTATAAGTTTLTVNSLPNQRFTGSTTQTIVMPVVTTLSVGWVTDIINDSTGTLTVNSSGGNLITTVVAGDRVTLNCVGIAADTTAAAWTVTKVSKSSGTSGGISLGTAIATTSGTSHTFTGIPAGVKRITVMFNGVSTNGTSLVQIQIGSGSFTTSGYASTASNTGANAVSTTGFITSVNNSAADFRVGVITLAYYSGTSWVEHGVVGITASNSPTSSCGIVEIPGLIDRIRIITVNGTDLFDAGSVNISWEF